MELEPYDNQRPPEVPQPSEVVAGQAIPDPQYPPSSQLPDERVGGLVYDRDAVPEPDDTDPDPDTLASDSDEWPEEQATSEDPPEAATAPRTAAPSPPPARAPVAAKVVPDVRSTERSKPVSTPEAAPPSPNTPEAVEVPEATLATHGTAQAAAAAHPEDHGTPETEEAIIETPDDDEDVHSLVVAPAAREPQIQAGDGGEGREIRLTEQLQPGERAALIDVAAALTSADSTVARQVNIATVRGTTLAARRTHEPQSSVSGPTGTDIATTSERSAQPDVVGPEDLAEIIEREWAKPSVDEQGTRLPGDARGRHGMSGTERQTATYFGEARGKSARRHFGPEDYLLSAPPRASRQTSGYLFRKKVEEGIGKNADPEGYALAALEEEELKRFNAKQAQHHRRNPSEPPTVRPPLPGEGEMRRAYGEALIKPGATSVDGEAAKDKFRQDRDDERYRWDHQYSPNSLGRRVPENPPPHPLTDYQRLQILAQAEREGYPEYAGLANVDTEEQRIATEQYIWDVAFLRMQKNPLGDLLLSHPPPSVLTPNQIRARIDDLAFELGDKYAAQAQVMAEVAEAQQKTLFWHRDSAERQTGILDASYDELANQVTLNMDRMNALPHEILLNLLSQTLTAITENTVRPGGPETGLEAINRAKLFDELLMVHLRASTDVTGSAQLVSQSAQLKAGEWIKGYDSTLPTAIVFSGEPDMTAPLLARLGNYPQVLTVNGHDTPRANRQLGQLLGSSIRAAVPVLEAGITADCIVVTEGGGYVPAEFILPRLRPGGSIVVSGSRAEHKLIAKIVQEMAAGKQPNLRVYELITGELEVSSNGVPVDGRSRPDLLGAIFMDTARR